MIEGIYQIGNIVKQGRRISEIASDIPDIKEDIAYKVGIINFNLDKKRIEIDTRKEYEPGDEDSFKYIKLGLTGRQNQFLCTFTDLKRLYCEKDKKYSCWLSIEDELKKLSKTEEIEQFLSILQKIKEIFYPEGTLDFSKVKIFDGVEVKGIKDKEEFNKRLKKELVFWTVQINGRNVIDYAFYDELLKKKIVDEKKSKEEIVCYMCGQKKEEHLEDFGRFPIKFFINDKLGFSQKLSDKWSGNFALCIDCYTSIFAGQKFILNNLKFNIGKIIDVLLIPEFVGEIPFTQEKIKEWAELTKDIYNPFKIIEESELREKLNKYKKYGSLRSFLLNYIFYEQNNSQFKIYSVVKDLPNSRIDELRERFKKYKLKILDEGLKPLEGYESIYKKKLIPLRYSKSDRKIIDKAKIAEIFSSILEGIPLNRSFLIREFWQGAVARYFSNTSYSGIRELKRQEDRDKEMCEYLLYTHQFLILLRELSLLSIINEKEEKMELGNIPEKLKKYIQELGLNEQETALFLLGTLIGDIGSRQVRYGGKPILNKINYQGMSPERLEILFNEVFEKLKHEKLLYPEKEIIYETAIRLFGKNMKKWNLKPYESVYFLLSGYAYKTALNIKRAKEGENGGQDSKR